MGIVLIVVKREASNMTNVTDVPALETYDEGGNTIKGICFAVFLSLLVFWGPVFYIARPVGHFAKYTLLAWF